MDARKFSHVDLALIRIDHGLRTIFGHPPTTGRSNPADAQSGETLNSQESLLSARLMRVNHAGEVSAQALYEGQALTASLPGVREKMEQAALEENDHLVWCKQRTQELGYRTSVLDAAWYAGSFVIGAVAGLAGDKWSLGFVAETERQVVRHLDEHLARLPEKDKKSRAILEQMKADETRHATTALEAGGTELPAAVKKLMGLISKIMTRTAYWV